ncbi:MAG: alternative ribosome rescue aminoacyl-tRNA hydrolase ArfB [Acidimicrobiia bacterium]|nr:alternative ribosome rescue aminoacyl-tRNA hydrolase ArfB [Acidimicrobiia bacterium]
MAEPIVVTDALRIDAGELDWRFTTSGGPGGQHANRNATRAEVRWDVAGSPSIGEDVRRRLVAKLGPVVVAAADESRSQLRNRELAQERLVAKLAAALVVPRTRRATRPGRGAVERRLTSKKRRAQTKRSRRIGPDDA